MISTNHIRTVLDTYLDQHPEDKAELAPLLELLDTDADLTSRHEYRGHVTASAGVINPAGQVLLIHHKTLGTWFFPGGHVEPEDTTLLGAALRELVEETGIDPLQVTPVGHDPIHIDIHPIPANPSKDEPEHQHIDFRYLFTADVDQARLQIQVAEVTDAAWSPPETIADQRLLTRITTHIQH